MRRALVIGVLALTGGCAQTPGEIPCRQGFARAADGHCYPPPPDPEPPTASEVIAATGPCVPAEPDGAVDVGEGCASGVCAGDGFATFDDALDGPADCEVAWWGADWQYCAWDDGIEGLFPDADLDGTPDPEGRTDWIHLRPGYDGATLEGLSVGVSPACWVEVLGTPSSAVWIDDGGSLALQDLSWSSYGVEIHDWDGPDGEVDDVYLFGPP